MRQCALPGGFGKTYRGWVQRQRDLYDQSIGEQLLGERLTPEAHAVAYDIATRTTKGKFNAMRAAVSEPDNLL